ncbi:MAG: asparaginase, partial [Anaerolineales bacterium]
MSYLPIVELTRGSLAESLHHGAVAIADPLGQLVAAYGDPHAVTFLRSSAKPFQAIPLVESGAAEAFRLTPRELALACASHRGLEMHVEAVAAMQMKIGVSEEDLLCGTH